MVAQHNAWQYESERVTSGAAAARARRLATAKVSAAGDERGEGSGTQKRQRGESSGAGSNSQAQMEAPKRQQIRNRDTGKQPMQVPHQEEQQPCTGRSMLDDAALEGRSGDGDCEHEGEERTAVRQQAAKRQREGTTAHEDTKEGDGGTRYNAAQLFFTSQARVALERLVGRWHWWPRFGDRLRRDNDCPLNNVACR